MIDATGRTMIGLRKLDQLQRMPIRIAELKCNDAVPVAILGHSEK